MANSGLEGRACVAAFIALWLAAPVAARAQAPDAALRGKTSSAAEGAMEGVVVSAKKVGSNITVSVVSDASGEYRFPASRLEPGRYEISVRAAGFALGAPAAAELLAGKAAVADLDL